MESNQQRPVLAYDFASSPLLLLPAAFCKEHAMFVAPKHPLGPKLLSNEVSGLKALKRTGCWDPETTLQRHLDVQVLHG